MLNTAAVEATIGNLPTRPGWSTQLAASNIPCMSNNITYHANHPAVSGFTVTTSEGSAVAHKLAAAELRQLAGADVDTSSLTLDWSD